MLLASAWYSSATLWAALAVPASLIAGFAAAWATVKATAPKRQLAYRLRRATPLLTATGTTLEVRLAGTVLTDPQIMEIQLVNRGKRDIGSELYDTGKPILLDLG
jgi:hypothetical protein